MYPTRIVCLTEETTETLYWLGEQDRIAGVSGFTVRPPEARGKPPVSAFLSADYYQHAEHFTGVVTALLGAGTPTRQQLLERRQCILIFRQFSQTYRVPCDVQLLAPEDALFKATYWHNAMFNPNLPPDVAVLALVPDWTYASRERDASA